MNSLSPISQLVENIKSSLNQLGSQDSNLKLYPKDQPELNAILSQYSPGNWLKLSYPYTFSVINLKNSGTSGFQDFSLPLAPQSIKQSEPPAISIRPTQGGTTVTHSGNRYKTLSIKGTTGMNPFRGSGGVDVATGNAILQPNELKYKSGYEVFQLLRNWFRAYYEYKKVNGSSAKDLRLVFKNYKDGEFLVVELLRFDMDRSSSRPLMYDYDLEFRVISHMNFKQVTNITTEFEDAMDNALRAIDFSRGVFLRTQDVLRQIESIYNNNIIDPLRKSALAIKAARNTPSVAADIGSRIIKNTVTSANALSIALAVKSMQIENSVTGLLDSRIADIQLPDNLEDAIAVQGSDLILSFGEGLMALSTDLFPERALLESAEEMEDSVNLPKSYYKNLLDELIRIRQNLEDAVDLGSPLYDQLFGRTASSPQYFGMIPDEAYDALNGFNSAIIGLQLLLVSDDMFTSTFDEVISDIISKFDGAISLQSSDAASEYILESGMTVQKLAQLKLGDSTRWGEIVELNGLEYPYFSDDLSFPNPKVAKPGTKLLIPAPIVYGFSELPEGAESRVAQGLSELEKSLGTDLKIDHNFDLVLSPNNDIEMIAGSDNLVQQIKLKLNYEPGDLIRYPEIGIGIVIGSKLPPISRIKDLLINTIMQDQRIQSVTDLSILRENSSLFLSFNLLIKQIDIPIPVKLSIGEA